jgi:hypothetical protein
LPDHPGQPLRTTTELQPAQLGDDELQMQDLGFAGGQLSLMPADLALLLKRQRLQGMEFIGQGRIHDGTLPDHRPGEQSLPQ